MAMFLVATYGEGEPTDNVTEFNNFFESQKARRRAAHHISSVNADEVRRFWPRKQLVSVLQLDCSGSK